MTPVASPQLQTVDAAGRLTLPAGYANATVAVETVSDGVLQVRRAGPNPPTEDEDDLGVGNPVLGPLSERDTLLLLDLLENPPQPSPRLVAAMARYRAECE